MAHEEVSEAGPTSGKAHTCSTCGCRFFFPIQIMDAALAEPLHTSDVNDVEPLPIVCAACGAVYLFGPKPERDGGGYGWRREVHGSNVGALRKLSVKYGG